MTAGILNIIGVDMGNIRDPDHENPKGYFEDKDFLSLHDNILEAADSDAHGFNPPPVEKILNQRDQFDGRIQDLIEQRPLNSDSGVWGWKVTTTSFTLPLFLPYLSNPYIVVVFRNQLDIAKSAVKYTKNKSYNELDLIEALDVTNYYYRSICGFLKEESNLPTLYVSFEDIVDIPREETKRIADFLEFTLEPSHLQEVDDYVSPKEEMAKAKFMSRVKSRFTNNLLLKYILKAARNPKDIPEFLRKALKKFNNKSNRK